MTRLVSWVSTHRYAALTLLLATLLAGALVFVAVARATDQSSFCASCHEMKPYYDAWGEGPHAGVPCVDCHVDDGNVNRLLHKMDALQEVWTHVAGKPAFPISDNAPVTDERCLRCHSDVDPGIVGFSHEEHRAGRPCADCHSDVGHQVSEQTLRDAGVFDPGGWADQQVLQLAKLGQHGRPAERHPSVTCQSCHDITTANCESCHTAEHEPLGACIDCHTSDDGWAFVHPSDTDCGACHETTEEHPAAPSGVDCVECHEAAPGTSWKFTHPSGDTCADCHTRPKGHETGACANCHGVGSSWSFEHPSASSTCTDCHARPAGHSSRSCTTCHATGSSWTFRHPSSRSTCTSCHARPAGHSSRSCIDCHKIGSSWRFNHPSAKNCGNCHRAPSSHYGSSCASCHDPSRKWSSATFSHPRVGEHSYRSFACSKCHPRGYSSASCTGCHGPGGPEDDD